MQSKPRKLAQIRYRKERMDLRQTLASGIKREILFQPQFYLWNHSVASPTTGISSIGDDLIECGEGGTNCPAAMPHSIILRTFQAPFRLHLAQAQSKLLAAVVRICSRQCSMKSSQMLTTTL